MAGSPLPEAPTALLEEGFCRCVPGGSVFGTSQISSAPLSEAVGGPIVDGGGCPAADLSAALSFGDDDVWGREEAFAAV
mgnify:CR=1 FL=1